MSRTRLLAAAFVLWLCASASCWADWAVQTVDASGNKGMWSSLALDRNGNPSIAYHDGPGGSGGGLIARYNGESWGTSMVQSWQHGPIAVKIDSAGNPAVAWNNYNGGDTVVCSKDTGYGYGCDPIGKMGYFDDGVAAGNLSLQLDSNDLPCVSYYDGIDHQLRFARYNGMWWDVSNVDAPGDVGYWNSLALDRNDNPAVSYLDRRTDSLIFARWNGTGWERSVVDGAAGTGYCTSLAFDANGNPRISYADRVSRDLRYAEWNGSSWVMSVADSIGDVGWFTSLALDALGRPHISYYDYSVGRHDLKYAVRNGTSWQTTVVDAAGDVGGYTSIAINRNGSPSISYYDFTNNSLKYALLTAVPEPSSMLALLCGIVGMGRIAWKRR